MGNAVSYLDTQVAVWLGAAALEKLSTTAKRYLQGSIKVSPIVLLELEYLFEIKRLTVPATDIVRKLRHELSVEICQLDFSAVVQAALAEKWTRDPFDRLIVAHAKANGLAYLVSSDETIRQNYVRTIW